MLEQYIKYSCYNILIAHLWCYIILYKIDCPVLQENLLQEFNVDNFAHLNVFVITKRTWKTSRPMLHHAVDKILLNSCKQTLYLNYDQNRAWKP